LENDKERSKTVDRAIKVLKLLGKSQRGKGLGVSEIARVLGISKSAVHRIVVTLEGHGAIQKDPDSSKYTLGWLLFELGSIVSQSAWGDSKRLTSLLTTLSKQVGETINWAVADGKWIVILEQALPDSALKTIVEVGKREPIHATALGKVMLAEMTEREIRRILGPDPLPRYGPNTIVETAMLIKQLRDIKENGYAIDNEEYSAGIRCIAVPVRNFRGRVVAALSISGPTQRFSVQDCYRALPFLLETAAEISKMRGYVEDKPDQGNHS
jgi:IclR family KDG regulon transcriptional repressor